MLRKHKTAIKVCAFILTFKIALADVLYAAPMDQLNIGVSPQKIILQDPARLEAPLDFTTLKEIYKSPQSTVHSPRSKLIIHIQDAHSNYSGQQNLASALDELMEKYKIRLVLVEGGTKDDTLTTLKAIAPTDVWRRVAKKFLMEGKIAGEEYLNLTSDHPMKIMGIEDRELYMKSLNAYSELAGKREDILSNLKRVRIGIEKIKNKVYPEELKEYEKLSTVHGPQSTDNEFEGGFRKLTEMASQHNIVLTLFPNIEKLKAIQDRESSIDFNAANLEQAALVEQISKMGGRENLRSALAKISKSKNSKLSQLNFVETLFRATKEKNIIRDTYPNLLSYEKYLKQFGGIDFEKFFDEHERLEDEVYRARLNAVDHGPSTMDALLIRSIDRYLGLLETAYRIQMSTKEFEMFKLNEPDFATTAYLAFINRKLADLGYFDDMIAYESIFEDAKGSLENFYQSVSERDEAFIKNTERVLSEDKQEVAILIAGGYHTQHLQKLFKEKGYSYAVLAPHVTSETNQKKYEKVLLEPVKGRSTVHGPQTTAERSEATRSGIRALPLMESGSRLASIAAYVQPDADKRAFDALNAATGSRLSKVERIDRNLDIQTKLPKKQNEAETQKRKPPAKPTVTTPATDWATFSYEALIRSGSRLAELEKLHDDEYAVSRPGLSGLFLDPKKISLRLNDRLGDPKTFSELTQEIGGVLFTRRWRSVSVVWSFKKADLEKVKSLLGIQVGILGVEDLKSDEYAVSVKGFSGLFINPKKISPQLNDKLGDPAASTQLTQEIGDVLFTRRRNGVSVVWSFKKDDLEKVKSHLGIQGGVLGIEALRGNEYAASQKGLSGILPMASTVVQQLKGMLGNQKTSSQLSRKFQGIVFTRRKVGPGITWSFKKEDLDKVRSLLGIRVEILGIEELRKDEYAISPSGLYGVFAGSQEIAPQLNEELGDPKASSQLTRELQGIVFTRRKNRTRMVWSFKKDDLEKVAQVVRTLKKPQTLRGPTPSRLQGVDYPSKLERNTALVLLRMNLIDEIRIGETWQIPAPGKRRLDFYSPKLNVFFEPHSDLFNKDTMEEYQSARQLLADEVRPGSKVYAFDTIENLVFGILPAEGVEVQPQDFDSIRRLIREADGNAVPAPLFIESQTMENPVDGLMAGARLADSFEMDAHNLISRLQGKKARMGVLNERVVPDAKKLRSELRSMKGLLYRFARKFTDRFDPENNTAQYERFEMLKEEISTALSGLSAVLAARSYQPVLISESLTAFELKLVETRGTFVSMAPRRDFSEMLPRLDEVIIPQRNVNGQWVNHYAPRDKVGFEGVFSVPEEQRKGLEDTFMGGGFIPTQGGNVIWIARILSIEGRTMTLQQLRPDGGYAGKPFQASVYDKNFGILIWNEAIQGARLAEGKYNPFVNWIPAIGSLIVHAALFELRETQIFGPNMQSFLGWLPDVSFMTMMLQFIVALRVAGYLDSTQRSREVQRRLFDRYHLFWPIVFTAQEIFSGLFPEINVAIFGKGTGTTFDPLDIPGAWIGSLISFVIYRYQFDRIDKFAPPQERSGSRLSEAASDGARLAEGRRAASLRQAVARTAFKFLDAGKDFVVLEDDDPKSPFAQLVLKVPADIYFMDQEKYQEPPARRSTLWQANLYKAQTLKKRAEFAKRHLGGIVAPFTILTDATVKGRWYPFVILQNKLQVDENMGARQKRAMIRRLAERGAEYTDTLGAKDMGRDAKGGLYLLDISEVRPIEGVVHPNKPVPDSTLTGIPSQGARLADKDRADILRNGVAIMSTATLSAFGAYRMVEGNYWPYFKDPILRTINHGWLNDLIAMPVFFSALYLIYFIPGVLAKMSGSLIWEYSSKEIKRFFTGVLIAGWGSLFAGEVSQFFVSPKMTPIGYTGVPAYGDLVALTAGLAGSLWLMRQVQYPFHNNSGARLAEEIKSPRHQATSSPVVRERLDPSSLSSLHEEAFKDALRLDGMVSGARLAYLGRATLETYPSKQVGRTTVYWSPAIRIPYRSSYENTLWVQSLDEIAKLVPSTDKAFKIFVAENEQGEFRATLFSEQYAYILDLNLTASKDYPGDVIMGSTDPPQMRLTPMEMSALFHHLESWLASRGFRRLKVQAYVENEQPSFFEQRGFRRISGGLWLAKELNSGDGARLAGTSKESHRIYTFLKSKFGNRYLALGGPIAQPEFFRPIRRVHSEVLDKLTESYGDELVVDLSYDSALAQDVEPITIEEIAAKILSGELSLPLIYKPNLEANGARSIFIDRSATGRWVLTMAHSSSGLYSVNAGYEKVREALRRYPEVFAMVDDDKDILRISINENTQNFSEILKAIHEAVSIIEYPGHHVEVDSGLIETAMKLITYQDRAYETRHAFTGNFQTGSLEFLKDQDWRMRWFGRLGSSSYYSNQTGRGFVTLYQYAHMYDPLYATTGISEDRKAEFETQTEDLIKKEIEFIMNKLRLKGVELGTFRGQLDLAWLPPDADSNGFPRPVLIEALFEPVEQKASGDGARLAGVVPTLPGFTLAASLPDVDAEVQGASVVSTGEGLSRLEALLPDMVRTGAGKLYVYGAYQASQLSQLVHQNDLSDLQGHPSLSIRNIRGEIIRFIHVGLATVRVQNYRTKNQKAGGLELRDKFGNLFSIYGMDKLREPKERFSEFTAKAHEAGLRVAVDFIPWLSPDAINASNYRWARERREVSEERQAEFRKLKTDAARRQWLEDLSEANPGFAVVRIPENGVERVVLLKHLYYGMNVDQIELDPTNPQVQDYWIKALSAMVDLGADEFRVDLASHLIINVHEGEPLWNVMDAVKRHAAGSGKKVEFFTEGYEDRDHHIQIGVDRVYSDAFFKRLYDNGHRPAAETLRGAIFEALLQGKRYVYYPSNFDQLSLAAMNYSPEAITSLMVLISAMSDAHIMIDLRDWLGHEGHLVPVPGGNGGRRDSNAHLFATQDEIDSRRSIGELKSLMSRSEIVPLLQGPVAELKQDPQAWVYWIPSARQDVFALGWRSQAGYFHLAAFKISSNHAALDTTLYLPNDQNGDLRKAFGGSDMPIHFAENRGMVWVPAGARLASNDRSDPKVWKFLTSLMGKPSELIRVDKLPDPKLSSTAASEWVDALGLDKAKRIRRVLSPALEERGLTVYRISALPILTAQLGKYSDFDLVYGQDGVLVSIFPVSPQFMIFPRYYYDLSEYRVPIGVLKDVANSSSDPHDWQDVLTDVERAKADLEAYKKAMRLVGFKSRHLKNERQTTWMYAEVDMKTLSIWARRLDLADLRPDWRASWTDRIFSRDKSVARVLLPNYPSVYPFAGFFEKPEWDTDTFFYKTVLDRLVGLTAHTGERRLDAATGSGFVAWLHWIALRAKGDENDVQLYAYDADPLSVANAKMFLWDIVGAKNIHLALGDSIRVFGDQSYRVVTANSPAIQLEEDSYVHPQDEKHWDGASAGALFTEDMKLNLPGSLDTDGFGIFWNGIPYRSHFFADFLRDAGLNVSNLQPSPNQSAVYLVEHAKAGARLSAQDTIDRTTPIQTITYTLDELKAILASMREKTAEEKSVKLWGPMRKRMADTFAATEDQIAVFATENEIELSAKVLDSARARVSGIFVHAAENAMDAYLEKSEKDTDYQEPLKLEFETSTSGGVLQLALKANGASFTTAENTEEKALMGLKRFGGLGKSTAIIERFVWELGAEYRVGDREAMTKDGEEGSVFELDISVDGLRRFAEEGGIILSGGVPAKAGARLAGRPTGRSYRTGVLFSYQAAGDTFTQSAIERLTLRSDTYRKTFETVSSASGLGFANGELSGPSMTDLPSDLDTYVRQSLSTLAHSVGLYRMMMEDYPRSSPYFISGISAGIFAALVVSEAVSIADIAKWWVDLWGAYVEPEKTFDIYFIKGLPRGVTYKAIEDILEIGRLELVQDASPERIVLAAASDMDRSDIQYQIKRRIPSATINHQSGLKIKASHTSFSRESTFDARIRDLTAALSLRVPMAAVVSSSNREPIILDTVEKVRDELAQIIFKPIYWTQVLRFLKGKGVDRVVEVGVGDRLTRFSQKIIPRTEALLINDDITMNSMASYIGAPDDSGARLAGSLFSTEANSMPARREVIKQILKSAYFWYPLTAVLLGAVIWMVDGREKSLSLPLDEYDIRVEQVDKELRKKIASGELIYIAPANPYFFDKDKQVPSGLVISNGRLINPANPNRIGSAMQKDLGIIWADDFVILDNSQDAREIVGRGASQAFQAGPRVITGSKVRPEIKSWYRGFFHGRVRVLGLNSAKKMLYFREFKGWDRFGIFGRFDKATFFRDLEDWRSERDIREGTGVDGGAADLDGIERSNIVLVAQRKSGARLSDKDHGEISVPTLSDLKEVFDANGYTPEQWRLIEIFFEALTTKYVKAGSAPKLYPQQYKRAVAMAMRLMRWHADIETVAMGLIYPFYELADQRAQVVSMIDAAVQRDEAWQVNRSRGDKIKEVLTRIYKTDQIPFVAKPRTPRSLPNFMNMLTQLSGADLGTFLLLLAVKMYKYSEMTHVDRFDNATSEMRMYQTMAGRRYMQTQADDIEEMILRRVDPGGYERADEARRKLLHEMDIADAEERFGRLIRDIQTFTDIHHMGAKVTGRIKSVMRFQTKTSVLWKYEPEEIPDPLGIRVVAENHSAAMGIVNEWVAQNSEWVHVVHEYEFKTAGWHNLDLSFQLGDDPTKRVRLEIQVMTPEARRAEKQGSIKPAHADYKQGQWWERVLGINVITQPRPLPELSDDPETNYQRQYQKLRGRIYVPTYALSKNSGILLDMDVAELAEGAMPLDFAVAQGEVDSPRADLLGVQPHQGVDTVKISDSLSGIVTNLNAATVLSNGDIVLPPDLAQKNRSLYGLIKKVKPLPSNAASGAYQMMATSIALQRNNPNYDKWVQTGQRAVSYALKADSLSDTGAMDELIDFSKVAGFLSDEDMYAAIGYSERKAGPIYPPSRFLEAFNAYLRSDRQVLPDMSLSGARLASTGINFEQAYADLSGVQSEADLTPEIIAKYFSDQRVGGAIIRSPISYQWDEAGGAYREIVDEKRTWNSRNLEELFLEGKQKIHDIAYDKINEKYVFDESDRRMLERFYVLHFIAHQFFALKDSKRVHKRGGGTIPYALHTVDATSAVYWEFKRFSPAGSGVIGAVGLAAELTHDVFEDTQLNKWSDDKILALMGLTDDTRSKHALMIARTMTRDAAEEEKANDKKYYLRLIRSIENEYSALAQPNDVLNYYTTLILKMADKLTSIRFDMDAISDQELSQPDVAKAVLVFLNERMNFIKYFASYLIRTQNDELRSVALYWNDQYLNIFEAQKKRIARLYTRDDFDGNEFVEYVLTQASLKPVAIRAEDEARRTWSAKGVYDGSMTDPRRTFYQIRDVTTESVSFEDFQKIWTSLRDTYPPIWEKDWLKSPQNTWALLTNADSSLSARILFAQDASGGYTVPAGISLYTHTVTRDDQVKAAANTVDAIAVHPDYRGHGANHVLIEDLRRGPLKDKRTVDILSFATSLGDKVNRQNGYTTINVHMIEEAMHVGSTLIEDEESISPEGARLASAELLNLALSAYRAGHLHDANRQLEVFAEREDSTLYELNAAIALLPWIVTDYQDAFALYYKLTPKYRAAAVQMVARRSNLIQSQMLAAIPVMIRMYGDSWLDSLYELRAREELSGVSDRDLATLVNGLDLLKDGLTEAHIRINAKMMNDALVDIKPFLQTFHPSFWDRHLKALLEKKQRLSPSEQLDWAIRYFQVVYDIRLSVPLVGKAEPKDIPVYKGAPAEIYTINDLPDIMNKLIEIDNQLAALPRKILLRSLTMRKLTIVRSARHIAGFWEFSDLVDQNNIVLAMDYAMWKQVLFHEIGHSLHGPSGKFATYIDPARFREFVSQHRSFFVSHNPSFVQQIERVSKDEDLDVPVLAWQALSIIYRVRLEQWKRVRGSEDAVRKLLAPFGLMAQHSYPKPSTALRYVFEDPELASNNKEPFREMPLELIAEYTQLYVLFPDELRKLDHVGYDFFSAILGSAHDASRVMKLASSTPPAGARLEEVQTSPGSFEALMQKVRILVETEGYDKNELAKKELTTLAQQMFDMLPEDWRTETGFRTVNPSRFPDSRGSLLMKVLYLSAAYGLVSPREAAYWQDVDKLIVLFNREYKTNWQDKNYHVAQMGALTVQDLVIQTIGVLRDHQMYVSASFQMDNVPEPYRRALAQADMAYSYAHSYVGQEAEDSMAMLPSILYWLEKLSADLPRGDMSAYNEDLRSLIARGFTSYLLHDQNLYNTADREGIRAGGVLLRQERVWAHLKDPLLNSLISRWIEEEFTAPQNTIFDVRAYGYGQIDDLGLDQGSRVWIGTPFSELITQSRPQDPEYRQIMRSLTQSRFNGSPTEVTQGGSKDAWIIVQKRAQEARYRLSQLVGARLAENVETPGHQVARSPENASLALAGFYGVRLTTVMAVVPEGMIPLAAMMPLPMAAGVSRRALRGGAIPFENGGQIYNLTNNNVPKYDPQQVKLAELLGEDPGTASEGARLSGGTNSRFEQIHQFAMEQKRQAAVFARAFRKLGLAASEVRGIIEIDLDRFTEDGSHDPSSKAFHENMTKMIRAIELMKSLGLSPLIKFYVYGHPDLVTYALAQGMEKYQVAPIERASAAFKVKITGAGSDQVERGKAFLSVAFADKEHGHAVYPILNYALYLLGIQNVKETATIDNIDDRVITEVLKLSGREMADDRLLSPSDILDFALGNTDLEVLETARMYSVRALIPILGARLSQMLDTLKALATAA